MRPGATTINIIIVSELKLANHALNFFFYGRHYPSNSFAIQCFFLNGRERGDINQPGMAGSPGFVPGSVSWMGSSGWVSQKVMEGVTSV